MNRAGKQRSVLRILQRLTHTAFTPNCGDPNHVSNTATIVTKAAESPTMCMIICLPEHTRNDQRWRKPVLSEPDMVQTDSMSVQDFCHCPAICIQNCTGFVAPI